MLRKKKYYLSLNNGKLLKLILRWKNKGNFKIDNDKISRPYILNKNMYIVKKIMLLLKLNNVLKLLRKIWKKKTVLDRGPSHPNIMKQNHG